MLISQHRGGHKHSGLLAVGSSLKRSAYRHFRLAESHIATHQAVHRAFALHVGLHRLRRLQLVGRVLIDKRSLKLMLQISVGRICESLLLAACGIKLDKVARDVFEFRLRALLHPVPRPRPKFVELRRHTLLATVFCQFVERMNRHKNLIIVEIREFYHLLHLSVDGSAHQPAKASHSMVDMHNKVAHLYLRQLLQRQRQLARTHTVALERVLMEAFKNLMVGKRANLTLVVYKSLMKRAQHRREADIVLSVVEDRAQTFKLRLAVGKYVYFVAVRLKLTERRTDDVEIFVEHALQRCVKSQSGIVVATVANRIVGIAVAVDVAAELLCVDHIVHSMLVALFGNVSSATARTRCRNHSRS